jgi:probable F420-dependent oxidoreductase
MEVGVIIHNAGAKASPESLVKTTQWADELGYHSVWLTDHVALKEEVNSWYPYRTHGRWDYPPDTPWIDPLLSLAWVGATVPALKVGTSVLVIPLRNPVLLAKQLSSLDFLTGGRVILGAGAGWMKEEFDLMGQDFANRGKRAVEMVQLMRQLWSGETVDFQGEFYQVSGCKMYPRPVHGTIPVVWGGHSDAAIKRVAKVGDGWHPTQITLAELEAGVKKLRQYCEEYGRDPASTLVIARPGDKYDITPEAHAKHLELGIDHLVVDTPIKQEDPDLSLLREKMKRAAEVCGLTPRR